MEDDYLHLKVVNNKLITFPKIEFEHQRREGEFEITPHPGQVNSFLETYNIVPTYIDPNYVYGYYDEVNGNWTGMIGHVCKSGILE